MSDHKNNSRRDFLFGKKKKPSPQENHDDSNPLNALVAKNRLVSEYLQHFSKRAMACEFEVFFNMNQYEVATEATLAAFQRIDELEGQLSVYQPESEISQLNRGFGEEFCLSDTLEEVLLCAERIHRETQGAFDITSTPLSKAWGFYQRQGAIPPESKIEEALKLVDASQIKLDNGCAKLSSDGLEINLNSIGKGYALDEATALIRGFGVHDFILHGGQSSVIARGSEAKELSGSVSEGWTVGLSHPFVPNHRLAEITLQNQSLATSGTARQGFFHQGRRYGHVIDPRTGWPTDHFLSTTVVGESAAICDALATAFFVMSLEEVQAYCDRNPDIAAILVLPESRTGAIEVETFNATDELLKMV